MIHNTYFDATRPKSSHHHGIYRYMFKLLSYLLIGIVVSNCSSVKENIPVYRYLGFEHITGENANDGIFQDFSEDSGHVGGFWWDTKSATRGFKNADINTYLKNHNKHGTLVSEFERGGHGINFTVLPKGNTPEITIDKDKITFEMKASEQDCVGLRIMEEDGEVWGFGPKLFEYRQFCGSPSGEWITHHVPFSPESKEWFFFPYSGNRHLGDKTFAITALLQIHFEMGKHGKYNLKSGHGKIKLRNIRVE